MAVNSQKTFAGKPEQSVTGAVATAPLGTTMPTTAGEALGAAWTASGYVTEDGLSFSQDRSTTKIKDWSGSTIRSLLDEFSPTVQYSEAETSYETMCRMVGPENVTKVNATTGHGEQLKVSFGPNLPPAQAFCFSMKDEDRRMRLLVPNGQITAVDSVSFVRNDIVKWSFTLEANDDGTGHSMYLLTDDGETVAVVVPEINLNHSNIQLTVGETFQLTADTNPSGETVTWTSSTATKASVADGLVTALEAGTTTITAKITVSAVDYSDTCAVTVVAAGA